MRPHPLLARGGLGLLALALGCAPAEAPCPECGTIVIASGADADILLPALAEAAGRAVSDQIFLKLADIGLGANTVGDSGYVPKLAESWTFENSRTLVFTLNDRAQWQDGEPVTARDVAFTFAAYRDTTVNAPAAPLLAEIDSVVARDARTVAFYFDKVYPSQFYDATHHMRILPAHILDTVPRDRWGTHPFARNPIGDGPYRLAEWKPAESIELEADSSFFLGAPGTARVIWRVVPDPATQLTQVLAGEADFAEAVLGPENLARLEQSTVARGLPYPGPAYAYLGFNLRDPLLSDRGLRRALALAVDREAIVRAVLDGKGLVPPGPLAPPLWVAEGAPPQLPFDSLHAAALLDSLGWRDANGDGIRERNGRPLAFDLMYPPSSRIRERTGVIMQAQLKRVGVDVRLVPIEQNTMLERMRGGRFAAAIAGWQIDLIPSGLRELWTSAGIGGLNYGAYSNPAFDAKVAEASVVTDLGAARRLWHEAIQIINDDVPAVWLFVPELVAGVNRRLDNVTIRPDEWWATLWTWRAGRRGEAR